MKLKKNETRERGSVRALDRQEKRGAWRPGKGFILSLSLFVMLPLCVQGQGWEANFDTSARVNAEGPYETNGGVIWILESFSPLELEPSGTANFVATSRPDPTRKSLLPNEGRLRFSDSRPGLIQNPEAKGDDPVFLRADGSITAMGWVDQEFTDLAVSADVNVEGGADGNGSFSRQGVMARWDKSNNFYWFFVDFAKGEYAIWRTSYFGQQKTLPGSLGKIEDFDNTKRYHLEFELRGADLRGRVYDRSEPGTRGKLVGDTGTIVDKDPQYRGVSGVLAELSQAAPFVPLEGSFSMVQSKSLAQDAPLKSKVADLMANVRRNPESFSAHRELAKAQARSGQIRDAVNSYREALLRAPTDVESLNNLAFLQATSADESIFNPAEAVANAELAFDTIMRAMNTRHTEEIVTQYSKTYLLKVAYTQAAAYAANKQLTETEPIIGGDTDAGVAYAVIDWATEVARNEHLKFNTKQTGDLVSRFEEARSLFDQGKALIGVSQP